MASKGIKTSKLKQETKDKPQTNDINKIREILTKVTEYLHTYIHINKTKIVKKKKSRID